MESLGEFSVGNVPDDLERFPIGETQVRVADGEVVELFRVDEGVEVYVSIFGNQYTDDEVTRLGGGSWEGGIHRLRDDALTVATPFDFKSPRRFQDELNSGSD